MRLEEIIKGSKASTGIVSFTEAIQCALVR